MGWKGMIFLPRLFYALALAAFIFTAAPARADDGIFRNFVWGVSKEDVRDYETAVFYKEEGNSLFFLLKPDDYRRQIRYDFTNGGLSAARFEYVEYTPPTADIVFKAFYDEEAALKAKFGDPVKEDFTFKDKTYKNYPQFWGRSLLGQDLQIRIEWAAQGTRIVLYCHHDGFAYQLYYTMEPDTESGDIFETNP